MATLQENLGKVWASTGGVTDPGDAKVSQGWIAEIPTFQNFNYVLQSITKNNLSLAEKGSWAWQKGIDYEPTAVVNKNGVVYKCITAHSGTNPQDPELDTTNSYWVFGAIFGNVDPSTLSVEDGVLLQNMNPRSGLVWSGQDLTIQNETALLNLKTDNVGTGNWLFGNVAGSLVAVDVGVTTSPDNRSLALSESTVHKIYHEGNRPVQSEVDGTIPANPIDGKLYARLNSNWVEASTITVQDEPPPPVNGNGQGWYNLAEGRFYIDIDDGDSSQWVPANPPIVPDQKATNQECLDGGDISKYVNPSNLHSVISSGVAGDVIVAKGTNSNGSYLIWASGFKVMYGKKTGLVSATFIDADITFPTAFSNDGATIVTGIGISASTFTSDFRVQRQSVNVAIPTKTGCNATVNLLDNLAYSRVLNWCAYGY